MELKDFDINKVKSIEKRNVVLSVRITKRDFEWMKENKVSASKLFNYILHKIMEKKN